MQKREDREDRPIRKKRRRPCVFCADKIVADYKNVGFKLADYMKMDLICCKAIRHLKMIPAFRENIETLKLSIDNDRCAFVVYFLVTFLSPQY